MDSEKEKNAADSGDSGNLNSEVSSLHDVKDENGNGIFHVTTKYKWILSLSVVLFFLQSFLIYVTVEGALVAEMWQVALWGFGGLLAFYSIFKKSVAALLFNMILFLGVSLITAWRNAFETFKPVIELFTGPL